MPPSQLPSLDELVTNPVVAAAVVVMIVNAIVYFTRFQPTWLALVVSEAYMLLGYIATGRTQPDQLFLAVIYGFLLVVPLAHVDANVLARLFRPTPRQWRIAGSVPDFFLEWF